VFFLCEGGGRVKGGECGGRVQRDNKTTRILHSAL
jgi:hypothetical protein